MNGEAGLGNAGPKRPEFMIVLPSRDQCTGYALGLVWGRKLSHMITAM